MKLKKTFSLLLALLLLATLIGCAPAETTTENAQLQTEETQQPQETEDIRPGHGSQRKSHHIAG